MRSAEHCAGTSGQRGLNPRCRRSGWEPPTGEVMALADGTQTGELLRVVRGLVAELERSPQLVDRLLAVHVPTADGRCRQCGIGGQAGHQPWPCRIQSYAAAAKATRAPASSSPR